MSNSRKQQLKQFRIQISQKYIKIIPQRESFKTQILIQKRTSKILLADKKQIYQQNHSNKKQIKYAALIIGVIQTEEQKFLLYVKTVYVQPLLPNNHRVYQIAQVDFVPFSPTLPQTKQILDIIQKDIFSFSFYFSFQRDLTLNFQQYYQRQQSDNQTNKTSKMKYFWNYQMLSHLIGEKALNKYYVKQNSPQKGKSRSPSKKEIFKKRQSQIQIQNITINQIDRQKTLKNQDQIQSSSQWSIPIMQGYYGTYQYSLKQTIPIQVYLLSRRSKHRSGARFYNRGIDQSGKCANFIQTQLVVFYGENLISVKYYTGSIPIFWQQTSQLSKVKITRQRELQIIPFRKHVRMMIGEVGRVMIVNLLEKKKDNQAILIKEYQFLVQQTADEFNNQMRYAFFDMNLHEKNHDHQKIWEFIQQINTITEAFRWFHVNIKTNVIYSTQKGAYRVSCLDCLTRTNRFLQILGFNALYLILQKVCPFKENFKKLSLQLLLKADDRIQPFLRNYRYLWQQKSQFESIIYTGSASTSSKKTKFLSQLQSTIISLQRYYNQKFMDQLKQKCLDIILYHKNYLPLFRSKHKLPINVSIMTWNVNAMNPENHVDQIQKAIRLIKEGGMDLIVVGLQEIIQLNTNNVMNDNSEESKQSKRWHKVIQNLLNTKSKQKSPSKQPHINPTLQSQFPFQPTSQSQFILVQKVQMVGLFMIIFISKKWIHAIKSIHKDIVKTGIKIGVSQKYGNKGGVLVRINVFGTSLVFTCAHLAAHQSKVKQRISDFIQIHQKAFQQNKESVQNQVQIDFSDYKFFFGDLNFRLQGEFKQLKQIIQNSYMQKQQSKRLAILSQLLSHDQLFKLMNIENPSQQPQDDMQVHEYFKLYKQSEIDFFPTYKLQKTTGQYSLQKSRNPSYCDRILFWKGDGVQQDIHNDGLGLQVINYSDIRIKGSDHRPVYAAFRLNLLKENRKNHQSVIIQQSYRQESQIGQKQHSEI